LSTKQFFVRQIKQVFCQQDFVGNTGSGVFHQEVVFVRAQHYAYRLVITFNVFFFCKVIEVQIHLPNILVGDFSPL
jgi:hypothetical protein